MYNPRSFDICDPKDSGWYKDLNTKTTPLGVGGGEAKRSLLFWREFHFLRTGHRGQPILATKPTTAEPTAVDPGPARAKRMVKAGAYATAGTARAKQVVMAVLHAMVAARIGWRSPPPQEGGGARIALARCVVVGLVAPSGGHTCMNAPGSAA